MNQKVLKIIVPIVMVCVVVVIFVFQSQNNTPTTSDAQFPLHVESVDITKLEEHNMPIIIDFGADECEPCKAMAPVLEQVNEDMQGKAIVQFVDVWKHPQAANDFPVQIIPTQILIHADGTPYTPSDEILEVMQFTKYIDPDSEEHLFTAHQGGLTQEQFEMILEDMGVRYD